MIWVDYVRKDHGRTCSVNTSKIYDDCGLLHYRNRSILWLSNTSLIYYDLGRLCKEKNHGRICSVNTIKIYDDYDSFHVVNRSLLWLLNISLIYSDLGRLCTEKIMEEYDR